MCVAFKSVEWRRAEGLQCRHYWPLSPALNSYRLVPTLVGCNISGGKTIGASDEWE